MNHVVFIRDLHEVIVLRPRIRVGIESTVIQVLVKLLLVGHSFVVNCED